MRTCLALALAMGALAASSADATLVTPYTSQSSWASAATGVIETIDFDDGLLPSSFSGGYVGLPTATPDFIPTSSPNVFQPTDTIPIVGTVLVTFAQPVNAVGAFFLDVETGFASTGFDFEGDGTLEVAFGGDQGDDSIAFLGFTTDMPLTTVTISFGQAGTPADGVAMDDFQFATIPEPSAFLFGLLVTTVTAVPTLLRRQR